MARKNSCCSPTWKERRQSNSPESQPGGANRTRAKSSPGSLGKGKAGGKGEIDTCEKGRKLSMHYLLFYEVGEDYVSKRAQFRETHLEKAWKASDRGELV